MRAFGPRVPVSKLREGYLERRLGRLGAARIFDPARPGVPFALLERAGMSAWNSAAISRNCRAFLRKSAA